MEVEYFRVTGLFVLRGYMSLADVLDFTALVVSWAIGSQVL